MRKIIYLALLALAAFPDDIKTGPAVGQPVPDFSAQDQDGSRRNLKSVMGPKGALLVFFRSADW